MTGVKDTGSVLEIVRETRERGVDAALVMVGDGPDREPLEQLAHDLGIARSTYFVGYQPEVAGYYRLFDAFLLPSVNEGTPVSAIEALASGTPVVATSVGGVPDVVRDGIDGYLVEPGDVAGAADRLATLAADEALRARLGEAGRARVTKRYSVARLVDDVDRLYRSLLAAKGLAPPPTPRGAP
jgi:glycosyltransferase involved in cell wall biosynthesis